MKLSELRKALKDVDIYIKPILNIRFIGRSVTEFMILEDYERQFKRKINSFGDFIKVIDDFDPREGKNSQDRELMDHARNRFVESCARIINSESSSPQVKEFYQSFVESNEHVKKAYSRFRKQKYNAINSSSVVLPNEPAPIATPCSPSASSPTDQDGDCDMNDLATSSRADLNYQ